MIIAYRRTVIFCCEYRNTYYMSVHPEGGIPPPLLFWNVLSFSFFILLKGFWGDLGIFAWVDCFPHRNQGPKDFGCCKLQSPLRQSVICNINPTTSELYLVTFYHRIYHRLKLYFRLPLSLIIFVDIV